MRPTRKISRKILTRRTDESFHVSGPARVTIRKAELGRVKVWVDAPVSTGITALARPSVDRQSRAG